MGMLVALGAKRLRGLAHDCHDGLGSEVLSEIMRSSSGGNWMLEKYNPFPAVHENAPASKGYSGGFGTDLMLKDLGLTQENAIATKASIPLDRQGARHLSAAQHCGAQGIARV